MDKLKETIRQSAEKWLTDLLGFAARNRFKELAAEKNPFTLFPEARTCIVIGRRITRGTLRGVEEGVNFGDYSSFGRG
ncbi:MAG: hypothetical protein GX633_06545, partial [Clostridiales bacterium]|nr:hypothetical protein [Clostridiales bacterium]